MDELVVELPFEDEPGLAVQILPAERDPFVGQAECSLEAVNEISEIQFFTVQMFYDLLLSVFYLQIVFIKNYTTDFILIVRLINYCCITDFI